MEKEKGARKKTFTIIYSKEETEKMFDPFHEISNGVVKDVSRNIFTGWEIFK